MNQGLSIFESEECVVCLETQPVAVFAPCRHRCTCAPCSALVEKSRQPCPLCRTAISDILIYRDQEAAGDVIEAVPAAEVQTFKEEQREEYIKKLRTPVTGDAFFKGKGKLARSVGKEVLSEMEERQRETRGTERVMSKRSTFLVIHNDEKQETCIQWKAGRAKRQDIFPKMTLEEARAGLEECLGGDRVSVLDVATHYPEYYWTMRLALMDTDQRLEEYLDKEMGTLKKGRK